MAHFFKPRVNLPQNHPKATVYLRIHPWYCTFYAFGQMYNDIFHLVICDFPGGSDGKVSAYNAGDPGSIPGSGRSPGEGNGNPLQYSCLENPMGGGAWWAAVHEVAESDMTEWLHFHVHSTMRALRRSSSSVIRLALGIQARIVNSLSWESESMWITSLPVLCSAPWSKGNSHDSLHVLTKRCNSFSE